MNCLFLWYVQFHLTVINTYKTVNLAWQCNFEVLVPLLGNTFMITVTNILPYKRH